MKKSRLVLIIMFIMLSSILVSGCVERSEEIVDDLEEKENDSTVEILGVLTGCIDSWKGYDIVLNNIRYKVNKDLSPYLGKNITICGKWCPGYKWYSPRINIDIVYISD